MSNKADLQGRTIVFTGQPKSNDALLEVERLGGESKVFPLIRTQEITSQDDSFIAKLGTYDWLIFTSQNAVSAFVQKLWRHDVRMEAIQCKVAAVGSKTADALRSAGLKVVFTPTTYSADVFVQQFPQALKPSETCLFIKGTLAKATITNGISQHVEDWTVYETLPNVENAKELSSYIQQQANAIIAFASPSAVDVFAREVAPIISWDKLKTAAIGHVTAAALEKNGAKVHVQPETYTWLALVQQIAKWKDDSLK